MIYSVVLNYSIASFGRKEIWKVAAIDKKGRAQGLASKSDSKSTACRGLVTTTTLKHKF